MTATIRRALVAVLAALALVPVAACSTPAVADAAYDPAVWGPTYQGQVYCGYVYTPAECAGRPGIPMQFPTNPPVAGTLGWALWTDYLTYPSYYHSDRYYRTVIVGRAHYTRVNINVFRTQTKTFDTRYATAEAKYDRSAKYKGPGGKTYTGNKYGSLSTTVTRKKTTTSGGGNAGTKSDPGKKSTTKTGGSKTTTKTGGGVTRKTGTGGSGSRYSGGSKYSGGSRSGYSGGGSRSGGFGGRR